MASVELLNKLEKAKLINPPNYVLGATQYLVITGSHAYQSNEKGKSDFDIYGWCIPPKDICFPHLTGYIGFGTKPQSFEQFLSHGIHFGEKEYDVTIHGIIKYFNLCYENNPNMLDTLFVPANCILHCTKIGHMVRDRRREFLHKGAYYKHVAYATSQLHKTKSRKFENSNRKEEVEKYGHSLKYSMHLCRLLLQAEQILTTQDLDLTLNKEILKSVRRGDWTLDQIEDWFNKKTRQLEDMLPASKLPERGDEGKIRQLLLDCLEEHFGSLDKCVSQPDKLKNALQAISEICNKVTNA